MLHMHVRPPFLAREEVEPKPLDTQDCRTHSDRIAHNEAPAVAAFASNAAIKPAPTPNPEPTLTSLKDQAA